MYCIYNGKAMQTVNPPDDSVGLSQMASATDGNLITFDASGNPAYVATGTDGQVLTSTGAGSPPAFEAAAAGGKVVQVVNVLSDARTTMTQQFSHDDTIPQNTEMTQIMSLAITPTNASNKLIIDILAILCNTHQDRVLLGLFQDSTAGALNVAVDWHADANTATPVLLKHYMAAGTTSSTTFKAYAAPDTAGTLHFNGSSVTDKFGGVMISSMTIMEIAV
jgi:hypothetical protein